MSFELTRYNLLYAQVCSDGTWDETLEWIRRENPAGTENNWSKDESPAGAAVPCANNPTTHKHYMFEC